MRKKNTDKPLLGGEMGAQFSQGKMSPCLFQQLQDLGGKLHISVCSLFGAQGAERGEFGSVDGVCSAPVCCSI